MEASHEGVKFKFIKNEQNSLQGKRLDPVWSHFLRSEDKSEYNRYIALCLYCKRTFSGRLPTMRKHITDQCDLVSSEDRATFIRSMNNTAAPAHLADDMKASSKKRFEMKNEVEVNKVAMKRKKTGSTISAYMEQKLDKNSQEEIHVLLLQALIWGNISFNFVNNPFFIRFLSRLRPSYSVPSSFVFSSRIFNSLCTQIVVENMDRINNRSSNGEFIAKILK